MLNTIEAVISQDGWVRFSEPYFLERSVKAYITILSDMSVDPIEHHSGQMLLQLLDSEPFKQVSFGEPEKLAQQIEQNRNAWND